MSGVRGARACISKSVIQDQNVVQIEWKEEFSEVLRRFWYIDVTRGMEGGGLGAGEVLSLA